MAKRIGVLGGISHESTARYYGLIHEGYYRRRGDLHYPEVVVFSLDFQRFTDLEDRGDTEGYIEYIMEGVWALERAGADFVVMAANSPHAVFEEVEGRATVPVISIAEVTADEAARLGLRTLLLLGIKFTMRSDFYQRVCGRRGIEVVTPSEGEQDEIDRIIFGELVLGVFREESRRRILEIISGYDVDGVILGCTELPLLIGRGDAEVPLLDTLELHVEATLDYSLSRPQTSPGQRSE
ncbi:MAG: amino acid racemase [Candidatus Bathyarchaeota archaeon]|nr:amino acid racemase [Candidatus Bathyarchaeota archaeon]MDH5790629.1 amino acid racemase [Candidatus Bathyarchaeota archaeon]